MIRCLDAHGVAVPIYTVEIDGVCYGVEEVEKALRTPTALQLAQEWQESIAILAADTAATLELDIQIELKEKRGHPFWWGKVSALRILKDMADADVVRCSGQKPPASEVS